MTKRPCCSAFRRVFGRDVDRQTDDLAGGMMEAVIAVLGTSGIDDLGDAELVIVILALDGGLTGFGRLDVQEPKLTGRARRMHHVPERRSEISAAGCLVWP